jgi:two-component system OmpR family response regulator
MARQVAHLPGLLYRCGGVPMRVLVVEDEPELLAVLAQALREEGYAVDEAADGDEGLFKATSWDYDAVVLDLMLPGRDGWQVLDGLRRQRATPVLVLTARDGVRDRVRGLDAGADDYLVKPFALAELLARLRALIRRAAGRAESVFTAGDVVLDTRAKTVTRGGFPVALTAREYALVELLLLRRGQLVTRSQIYEHLFDENEDSLSNLVEVHVSNVRKKLGKDFISTRRGQGYIIDV